MCVRACLCMCVCMWWGGERACTLLRTEPSFGDMSFLCYWCIIGLIIFENSQARRLVVGGGRTDSDGKATHSLTLDWLRFHNSAHTYLLLFTHPCKGIVNLPENKGKQSLVPAFVELSHPSPHCSPRKCIYSIEISASGLTLIIGPHVDGLGAHGRPFNDPSIFN